MKTNTVVYTITTWLFGQLKLTAFKFYEFNHTLGSSLLQGMASIVDIENTNILYSTSNIQDAFRGLANTIDQVIRNNQV